MGDSVEIMVGRLEGQMEGIGREIGEIKKLLECQSKDCASCREEIDKRDSAQDKKIEAITTRHVGESAVKTWFDNGLVRIGIAIGAIAGIVALTDIFVH